MTLHAQPVLGTDELPFMLGIGLPEMDVVNKGGFYSLHTVVIVALMLNET